MNDFAEFANILISINKIPNKNIFNIDKTNISFLNDLNTMYAKKSSKTVGTKQVNTLK